MAPVKNGRLLFNEIPTGYPEPGKTTVYDESQTIDLDNVPLNGGILTKTLSLSIDPYLRGRMRDPKKKSYNLPFVIGEPISNAGISVVIRSENSSVKPGDHVYAATNFQEYNVVTDSSRWEVLKNAENLPWDAYLGVLGMPGHTSYVGWKEYAFPRKEDVVFVSGGAGPVGSLVIQMAKGEGLKVISSAGSDDKVEFLKSIGADVAFNYKTQKASDVLQKEGPIDIYWDNVGGETLEATIDASARGARIIACGYISSYNGEPYPIKNLDLVVSREIKISGFIVTTLWPKYKDAFENEIPKRVASGHIKYKAHITKGLRNSGQALRDIQTGSNNGKSVVVVAEN